MKYLVTGSAGLLGSQLVSDLEKSGQTVYSCYNNTKPQFGIPIKLDLLNFDEIPYILKKINPDIVIHLAALTDVEKCEEVPEIAISINVKATEIIAKESHNLGFFLIYLSTDYVFDGKRGMFDETDLPNPLSQYGESKLCGEKAVESYASKWSVIRTSTPFDIYINKKTFPIWLLQNYKKNKKINVLEDQFTSPTYVPNLSKMILEISSLKLDGYIHLAGSTRISRFQFAKKIFQRLDLNDSLITPVKMNSMYWKASRPLDSSLDVSKANSILTIKPLSIDESLDDYIPKLKNSFSL